jgi:hypothetical protein
VNTLRQFSLACSSVFCAPQTYSFEEIRSFVSTGLDSVGQRGAHRLRADAFVAVRFLGSLRAGIRALRPPAHRLTPPKLLGVRAIISWHRPRVSLVRVFRRPSRQRYRRSPARMTASPSADAYMRSPRLAPTTTYEWAPSGGRSTRHPPSLCSNVPPTRSSIDRFGGVTLYRFRVILRACAHHPQSVVRRSRFAGMSSEFR